MVTRLTIKPLFLTVSDVHPNSNASKSHTPTASSVRTPTWLTAGVTRFAFSGCDDEHSQAQRRVGV